MKNRIGDILREIIGNATSEEEVLEKLKEQFPGADIELKKIEANMRDEHEKCDCPPCEIKRILEKSKFWDRDGIRTSNKYKIAQDILREKFGSDTDEWINFLAMMKSEQAIIIEKLNDILDKFDNVKLTERICKDNIEELCRYKAKK